MNTVLTVCSGLILIACAFALQRCIFHADRLLQMRQRLEDIDTKVGVLDIKGENTLKQLQSLRGRFYAITAPPPITDLDDDDDDGDERRPPLLPLASPFCANFGQAQLEGPTSPAARCECGYCGEMRARRAAARSADLARARLLTGGKANGSE